MEDANRHQEKVHDETAIDLDFTRLDGSFRQTLTSPTKLAAKSNFISSAMKSDPHSGTKDFDHGYLTKIDEIEQENSNQIIEIEKLKGRNQEEQ
jgi:hypothetical protein